MPVSPKKGKIDIRKELFNCATDSEVKLKAKKPD